MTRRLSVPGVLEEIAKGERDGVDGYVLACFGDPGLDAARELASRTGGRHRRGRDEGRHLPWPRLHASSPPWTGPSAGPGISPRTTASRSPACNVRACEIAVLELDVPGSAARDVITAECARAVAEDGCDVIVLGCAGMADLAADISSRIGVPVVDGVAAATTMVQSLVAMGLKTSTRSEFAAPIAKDVRGLLSDFALT